MPQRVHPAPTETQRVITAMWELDRPATMAQLAADAHVDLSDTAVILRDLRTKRHAVTSETPDGTTLWRLTLTPDTIGAPTTPHTGTQETGIGITATKPTPDGDAHAGALPDTPTAAPVAPVGGTAAPIKRGYRRSPQPRRPQGQLRMAALAVLMNAPDRDLRVSEVRKLINATLHGGYTEAGDGAVANALQRLVEAGDAIRVGKQPGTYQLVRRAS